MVAYLMHRHGVLMAYEIGVPTRKIAYNIIAYDRRTVAYVYVGLA